MANGSVSLPPGFELETPSSNIPAGFELETPGGTPPPTGNVIRPAETGPKAFLENLMSDIQSGTTITPIGRVLRGMGAGGTRSGVSGDTGAIVGGPAEGIPRFLHGAVSAHEGILGGQMAPGLNEMFQGAGQVVAPIAGVTNPAFLPAAVGFGLAQQGVQKTASALGAGPDTAQLLGNVAGTAALGVPKIPEMFGARGTPAERLSAALAKTLPKAQWAQINERLAQVNDKLPEVIGGSKSIGGVAGKMKARSLALDDQFSNAIEPVKGKDITPQVARLRASLEQEAVNADPYRANAYRAMADKVSEVKTLDQLNQLVKGINKGNRFSAGPESMVRQSLTQTVQGLTGQDFSPLRLEQSHWMTLARATQKAAIPEQLEGIQSKVMSPARKATQLAAAVPKNLGEAILKGSKALVLQPSARSLIESIKAPTPVAGRTQPVPPEPGESAVDMATRRPPVRTAEAEQIRNTLLQNQNVPRGTGMNTSGLDPATATNEDIMNWIRQNNPAAQGPAREMNPARAGTTAEVSAEYNPQVVQQHASALEQAKAQLPNGTLSEQLQLAAKIQRGGQ